MPAIMIAAGKEPKRWRPGAPSYRERAMAKRSVRRDRRAGAAGGGPPLREQAGMSPPVRPWRTFTFWLGGAVVGVVVAILVAGAFALIGGGDDESPAAAEKAPATPETIDIEGKTAEELAADFEQRDREQVKDLTATARRIVDAVAPVMSEYGDALPDQGGAQPAGAERVEQWLATVREQVKPFEESVSGETATNVARATVRSALDSLTGSLETYRLAAELDADRDAIYARARAQRELAIRTWSAAITQVDYVNVTIGFGHQHVPPIGGGAPPDDLPEGTDARPAE